MRTFRVLLVLVLATWFMGCAQPQDPVTVGEKAATAKDERAHPKTPAPSRVVIKTPRFPVTFNVEVARTDPQRRRGLMFREHLDEEAGMLFLFDRMRVQSFWMKNTKIPLDMIFIDDQWQIVGIVENAEPLTLTGRKVNKPSRYVLEIGGGMSRRLGIAAGQKVQFFEGAP